MNYMKKPKWLLPFMLIILLINLSIKYFGFADFEVQLHDTYLILSVSDVVFLLSLIVMAILAMYMLVEVAARKYKILALIIAIVNPIAALFILILIYAGMKTLTTFSDVAAESSFAVVVLVAILFGLFCLQVVIEISALRKLSTLVYASRERTGDDQSDS